VGAVEGWTKKKLNGLAEFTNGFAFKPADWGEEGKPIIRIQNLNGSKDFNHYAGPIHPKYQVEEGTLLFAWSGNRGTSFGPYVWKESTGLLNQHIFKVVPSDEVDQEWFYYALDVVRQKVERDAHGAIGLVHVRREDLAKYQIDVPTNTAEQAKIAEILLTVDRAIEQTEALIVKQQRIKTGLMQDLLTRGIDEHGNLRSEQTHKFKDSPLGRIPVEWEVESLGHIIGRNGGKLQTGPFGSQLHSDEYVPEGIPVVMPQDITANGILTSHIARITSRKAESLARHRVRAGDLVLARRGDLSRCVAIGEREQGWLCGTGCLLMTPPAKVLSPRWIAETYRLHSCQLQLAISAVGSTMPNLNTGILLNIIVALPSIEEQIRVEGLLRAVENNETAVRNRLNKIGNIKTALMQSLLTGAKRVTAFIDDVQRASTCVTSA
jgi:type I restriction enzyme, S subunit